MFDDDSDNTGIVYSCWVNNDGYDRIRDKQNRLAIANQITLSYIALQYRTAWKSRVG